MIVVAGEALIDLVAGEEDDLRGHPGGGPFNVARTIARLEQPAAYLGRLSTDRFGRRLRAALERDGVRLEAVIETDAPTTLALAELAADGGACYRFYEQGTSAPGLTLPEALSALPERVDTLYAGTLGLVFEPMATTLEALVEGAAASTLVAVDPNVRPTTIADPAAFRGRLGRILERADVVKVSAEDLAWLAPDAEVVAAARGLLGPAGAVALVTLGADGALVVSRDSVHDVPPVPARVIDTIGAGDAFMGGFLAWWERGGLGRADLTDRRATAAATSFACEVAARTVARPGADPPRLAELSAAPA
jgi:fructokinase